MKEPPKNTHKRLWPANIALWVGSKIRVRKPSNFNPLFYEFLCKNGKKNFFVSAAGKGKVNVRYVKLLFVPAETTGAPGREEQETGETSLGAG